MKNLPGPHTRSKKVACTVSAAALMLGVSQAATVGLHFQVNYCADARYTGFPVTMTAFGIASNAWENLAMMDTGYGCASGTGPYTLNQVVDTTTSSGGLNPLPNGSLTLTWTADTANFSGFGSYGVGPPSYGYFGPPPVPIPTGEWEIYSSFLRDGVNFGPNGVQPGYTVDIVGLQSLFTNTPFVVQLIAASDSMQYLTNAFIIDATANTTQSVYYPSTPTVIDVNDEPWIRGHGGGLSTASPAMNTDHLKIIGNRAAHQGPKTGYNFASTISGFILTDKPVISMPPNSVLANPADTVLLSAYAVGVPPMSFQWRKNGQPIPGATALSYSLTNAVLAYAGNYDLVVTNLYGAATSKVAVVTVDHISATPGNNFVVDSNPQNPEHDGLNSGASWLASSTDALSITRQGVMNFNAAGSNQITVPVGTTFNSPTGTIMFWVRSAGVANPAGNPAILFDRRNGQHGSGCVLVQNTDGTVQFQADNGSDSFGSVLSVSDNHWHQVALTFDQSLNGAVTLYIDGVLNAVNFNASAWSWQPGQQIELGLSNDQASWQPFNGILDDVRVYNRVLSDTEIAQAFTGSLVDNTALLLRLNFDAAPQAGVTLQWQCTDAVLQSSSTVNGSYTDVPGISSPYPVAARGASKFFRYRGHTPTNVVSNPYLM